MASTKKLSLLLLLCMFAIPSPAGDRPTLTPAQMVAVRQVTHVSISGDGTRVAFAVSEPPGKDDRTRHTTLWTLPTSGNEAPVEITGDFAEPTAPLWSPDGAYLAFLSAAKGAAGGGQQITLLRLSDGRVKQVSSVPAGVDAFSWSPEGRFLAFVAKRLKSTPNPPDNSDDPYEAELPHSHAALWMLDVRTQAAAPITPDNLHVSAFCWSADGTKLAARVSDSSLLDDAFWHSRLVIIDRQSGQITRAISDRVSPWEGTLEWSPDGQSIVFPEFTPRKIAARLTLRSLKASSSLTIAADYPGTIKVEKWTTDSRRLIAEAIRGTTAQILSIDPATNAVSKLADVFANPNSATFSVTPDGNTFAYLCSKHDAPGDVCVLNRAGAPRQITHLHAELANFAIGMAHEISWRNRRDGRTVYGVLYLPADYEAGHRYPTVVDVHGGPLEAWATGWNGWADLLASNGYAVLLPNPRGSEGNGWEFAEENFQDWGGKDFEDIMAGVDELVSRNIADPQRLGIGGRSFGGFMTTWVVTQTRRFKAAVEGAGITDLLSFDGQTTIAPSFLEIYFGGTPWQQWRQYQRHSPVYYAANAKTPVLIQHGTGDDVVPYAQSWEFYRALKMNGTEAKLVLYPREWHVFREPAHQIDEMRSMMAWFDRYLK